MRGSDETPLLIRYPGIEAAVAGTRPSAASTSRPRSPSWPRRPLVDPSTGAAWFRC